MVGGEIHICDYIGIFMNISSISDLGCYQKPARKSQLKYTGVPADYPHHRVHLYKYKEPIQTICAFFIPKRESGLFLIRGSEHDQRPMDIVRPCMCLAV
jgi:hypothetical protein